MTHTLKNDRYRKSRGGYMRLLRVSCQKCDCLICLYQKDGPGNLRRMYIDRITNPVVPIQGKALKCKNGHIIGMRIIYEKEKRPAIRLFVDSVKKKIVRS